MPPLDNPAAGSTPPPLDPAAVGFAALFLAVLVAAGIITYCVCKPGRQGPLAFICFFTGAFLHWALRSLYAPVTDTTDEWFAAIPRGLAKMPVVATVAPALPLLAAGLGFVAGYHIWQRVKVVVPGKGGSRGGGGGHDTDSPGLPMGGARRPPWM